MRTAIIGAGNMGGSIARGLAKGSIIPASDIIVSNPSQGKLDELQAEFPALQITHDNQEAMEVQAANFSSGISMASPI